MESPDKVLLISSGAIKIGEAAEFDYSGNQALKALKEEGIEVVLVNPNIATVQTSYKFADKVYLAPLEPGSVARIIEAERPGGIMIGFGGQTALSLGVRLHDEGVLREYGVKVLGTPIEGVRRALSRSLFRASMEEHGIPVPPSRSARGPEEALEAAEEVGYPVIVRVSFNLGGAGSFIAWDRGQLGSRLRAAFAQSGTGEVLVERYLHAWKEVEFEVVRDSHDNVAAIACMENLDPMGVHTGESVVVAPCQTLTDQEYQLSRRLSIAVERAITLVGEGNVQVAINPRGGGEAYVIETNPRMSRSSALASKATGYPLAYIAAKLALGYRLYEIINKVTGTTSANFEPSLDYVVVKIPRWDLDKFDHADRGIGSEMKSVGEVMGIGRSFLEALQKAIRMLDVGEPGLTGGPSYEEGPGLEEVLGKLRSREPYWPLWAARAFKLGASVEEVYELTGVDRHYLLQIREAVELHEALRAYRGRLAGLEGERGLRLLAEAKRMGFSDQQIARALGASEDDVRRLRRRLGLKPVVKRIDTLAAEWPARTNYLYLTYNGWEHDVAFRGPRPKILVLGAGGFRVGVSVEFDWSVVAYSDEARELGYEVVVLNYNPETVSTDWDVNERLYFDEVSVERVLDIYELEEPAGAVASLGGQISNSIALELEERGVRLVGTPGRSIDRAENRGSFSGLLEELGIRQPPWTEASSVREALEFAESVGYPVLARPSYVLSGTSMRIASSPSELRKYLEKAARASPRHPVVVSKFMEDAVEFEVDAVGDGRSAVGAVIEHVESAGVHSGDSTMSIPKVSLPNSAAREASRIALALNEALGVKGPFNLQLLHRDGVVYVIELNLRASRSMPFTSKTTGYNLMRAAAQASLGGRIADLVEEGAFNMLEPDWHGVKSPQFSWPRLRRAYPHLGPEMKSVGEAAALARTFHKALLASWLGVSGNRLPLEGEYVLVYDPTGRRGGHLGEAAHNLLEAGYRVVTVEGIEVRGPEALSEQRVRELMVEGRIGLVVTTGNRPDMDYRLRRLAADLAVPLILDHKLALELSRAIKAYRDEPLELRDLKDYWRDWRTIINIIK